MTDKKFRTTQSILPNLFAVFSLFTLVSCGAAKVEEKPSTTYKAPDSESAIDNLSFADLKEDLVYEGSFIEWNPSVSPQNLAEAIDLTRAAEADAVRSLQFIGDEILPVKKEWDEAKKSLETAMAAGSAAEAGAAKNKLAGIAGKAKSLLVQLEKTEENCKNLGPGTVGCKLFRSSKAANELLTNKAVSSRIFPAKLEYFAGSESIVQLTLNNVFYPHCSEQKNTAPCVQLGSRQEAGVSDLEIVVGSQVKISHILFSSYTLKGLLQVLVADVEGSTAKLNRSNHPYAVAARQFAAELQEFAKKLGAKTN